MRFHAAVTVANADVRDSPLLLSEPATGSTHTSTTVPPEVSNRALTPGDRPPYGPVDAPGCNVVGGGTLGVAVTDDADGDAVATCDGEWDAPAAPRDGDRDGDGGGGGGDTGGDGDSSGVGDGDAAPHAAPVA